MRESLTTVLGVLLAALLAFWFDRQKRQEENAFNMKQDAFLHASETLHRFLSYYLSIPDRPLPQDGNSAPEANEISIALNKLHFFCSLETITCVCQFSILLGEAVTEAVSSKMPSAFLAEEIKVLDMQIASYEATNEKLQQETELLLQSDPRNLLIASYKKHMAENFGQIAECHRKKSELIRERYIETEKCRDVVCKYIKPLSESSRDLLILARDELKFPINRASYHTLMSQIADASQQRLTDFMNTVRGEVNKRMGLEDE